MKPDFAAQTGEELTKRERWDWLQTRVDEFKKEGAALARATFEPTMNLLLVEAWKDPRAEQGQPQFFITSSAVDQA